MENPSRSPQMMSEIEAGQTEGITLFSEKMVYQMVSRL
jgi:hypothetical protein